MKKMSNNLNWSLSYFVEYIGTYIHLLSLFILLYRSYKLYYPEISKPSELVIATFSLPKGSDGPVHASLCACMRILCG